MVGALRRDGIVYAGFRSLDLTENPEEVPELDAARKALAAAVKKHDLKAIVALSRFLLAFSGHEAPDKITKEQFLSDETQFSSLF